MRARWCGSTRMIRSGEQDTVTLSVSLLPSSRHRSMAFLNDMSLGDVFSAPPSMLDEVSSSSTSLDMLWDWRSILATNLRRSCSLNVSQLLVSSAEKPAIDTSGERRSCAATAMKPRIAWLTTCSSALACSTLILSASSSALTWCSSANRLAELHQVNAELDAERIRVEQANAELHVVNQAIRGFIAVAAHDLRSPLVSIAGFSALLTKSWETFSEQDRRKFVASIDRQSHNMSKLVDELLTSSSIEGGALNTSPKLISLRNAIDRCLELGNRDTESVAVSCSPDLIIRRSTPPGTHSGQLRAERIQVRRTARAHRCHPEG